MIENDSGKQRTNLNRMVREHLFEQVRFDQQAD